MGESIAMAPAMAGGVQPLVTAVSQRPRKRATPIFFATLFLVVLVVVAVGSFALANSMRTPEAQVRPLPGLPRTRERQCCHSDG